MRDAAARLVGTHDFSSFRANGCQAGGCRIIPAFLVYRLAAGTGAG
jgi:tRNA U38,U39,U40 pseudouridine synthase TruA